MIKGFREFILRGNVIDLAVGIVIGAAFAALVTAFTAAFIEPLIRLIGGGGEVAGIFTVNGVDFDWGAFVNAVITFLITAAAIYSSSSCRSTRTTSAAAGTRPRSATRSPS